MKCRELDEDVNNFPSPHWKHCSCFGVLHHKIYPGYFFCMNCEYADDMEWMKPNLQNQSFESHI